MNNLSPRWLLSCILFSAFCLFPGCSHFKPGRKPSDPRQVWQKVADNYRLPRPPYRAEGQIGIRSGDYDQSVSFTLRWQRPGRMRVDVAGFLGFTLASLALDDTLAWLSIPIRGIYLKGSLGKVDSVSSQTLGVAMDPLLLALEGRPPLPKEDQPFESDTSGLGFSFRDSLASRAYQIEPTNMMIASYRFAGPDSVWQEISYSDWRRFSETFRPGRIELSKPDQNIRLSVSYSKIAQVDSFDQGIWNQTTPNGKKAGEF
jgi:outer membrane biogenesis lipoprotein LolB